MAILRPQDTGLRRRRQARKVGAVRTGDPQALGVRYADGGDLLAWADLRAELWPGEEGAEHVEQARDVLGDAEQVALLLVDARGAAHGFLEGRIHSGPPPYGHVEGWFVRPACRGAGHGRRLMETFEQWCLHRALPRLTSDTCDDDPLSPAAHARAGFREVSALRIFVRDL
jgi:aminoglycoside 6'-N-acetyltransferase I